MKELSLDILEAGLNSIRAGAQRIELTVSDRPEDDSVTVAVRDDGAGMTPCDAARAGDPFYTTGTEKRVGMGLALFRMDALLTGGSFRVFSQKGAGTAVEAVFVRSSINRPPLGDMGGTIEALLCAGRDVDIYYSHSFGQRGFVFSIPQRGEERTPAVLARAAVCIRKNIDSLYGGASL